MRGSRWLVSAMIGAVAMILALPSAEATHLRTKYSEPDLQALLTNPSPEGNGFYVIEISDITATVRCCPQPDSDQGCKSTKPNHLVTDQTITFDFDTPECKNGNRCNFNTQLLTLRDVADQFEELVCPGSQVVRQLGVPPDDFPEMAFKSLTALFVGVDCGELDCSLSTTCDTAGECPVTDCFEATFDYPFTIKTLPMDGNFKSSDGDQLASCPCVGCQLDGSFVKPPSP